MTDLDNYTATAVTRQIVALAHVACLRPEIDPSGVSRGTYRVIINAAGTDGLFGAITIGARTGRILHAHLTHGNWGEEKRYDAVAEIRTVFKSWAALQRTGRPLPAEPAGLDWAAMQPEQFDTEARLVQCALFAEPDRCGTPDLFDGEWN
jgi:hypothetical protein